MKTKFKLLMVLTLFVLTNTSFSQDNRFIEVKASDTIELKPIEFTYQIVLKTKMQYQGYSFSISSDTTPSPTTTYIETLLKTNKFIYKILDVSEYTISYNSSPDTTILVNLNSEKELNRLVKLLVPINGITTKIIDTKYESITSYINQIYKNLYTRALSDATLIASISGNTIGKLISVEEFKDTYSDLMDTYGEMLKESTYFKNPNSLNKVIIRKLIFKFQII